MTGTLDSQHGAELAFALAQASRGSVTALHVTGGRPARRPWKLGVGPRARWPPAPRDCSILFLASHRAAAAN